MPTSLDKRFLDHARLTTTEIEQGGRKFKFHAADAQEDHRGVVLALSEAGEVIGYVLDFEGREHLAIKVDRMDLHIAHPIVSTAEGAIDAIAF